MIDQNHGEPDSRKDQAETITVQVQRLHFSDGCWLIRFRPERESEWSKWGLLGADYVLPETVIAPRNKRRL